MLLLSLYVLFWPDPAGGGSGLPGADKVVHAVLFGVLTWTALRAFRRTGAVLAAVVAYAVLSEVVQAALLRTRSGDLLDLVADLVGVGLAVALPRRGGGVRA